MNYNELLEIIAAEQQLRNREIPYLEDAKVGKDMFANSYNDIMEELEDSELINRGLLDEIEARMLEDNPTYVPEIVRQARIQEYVELGVEEWKAIEIVDQMLATDTEKGVAGVGTDALEHKNIALESLNNKVNEYATQWQKDYDEHKERAPKFDDVEANLRQTIRCANTYKVSFEYDLNFCPADEQKLKNINAALKK